MHSTQNPQQVDPHADPHDDVLVARIDEELSKLAHDAMRDPLDPQTHTGSDVPAGPAVPPVDTTFRPAAVNQGLRPSFGMRAVRAFVGFLLAVCIGVAGVVWQAYGDAAKQMIARWTPQLVATSSPPPENPGLPEQPNPPAVQANAAKAAPPQPAPPAQAAAEGVAPAAAAARVLPPAPAPYVPRQPEAPPQVTAQPQAEPELSPVPRPPMPVLR